MVTLYATPDVEAAVITYLKGFTAAPISTKIPDPRPDQFHRVRRAGGQDRNRAQTDVRITVESWAPTDTAACDAARLLEAALRAAEDSLIAPGAFVTRVQVGSLAVIPDDKTGTPRYQFVAQLLTNLTPMEVLP